MVTHVIKRTGRRAKFSRNKIINAITRASKAAESYDDIAHELAEKIALEIEKTAKDCIDVEEIQDLVERKLMASSRKDTAKAYITYRYLKQMARSQYDELWNAIADKLTAKNIQNQNANVDEKSFGGRMGEANRVMSKKYALEFLVSEMAKNNHENNRVYIHDLDSYAIGNHNCLSIPFDDLLANGFNTRQTDVRPANSINTAFQLVAVIFQIQSLQQFGGVSATHIDHTMVPYVRKSFAKHYKDGLVWVSGKALSDIDYEIASMLKNVADYSITDPEWKAYDERAYDYALVMTTKETYQAVEGMYHNLNTLQSRSGNQLPFSSINYGTCTLPEGRMVTKALLEVSIAGLGKLHKTSIFPCGIFQYWKGVNDKPGTPNYDLYQLALKSTSMRLYPNYANVDWSGNAGFDPEDPRTYFSTMGCRTANGWDINGFGQLKDGRGNICPVTVILPTIAMEATEILDETRSVDPHTKYDLITVFFKHLEETINDAKDMLLERFDWICSQDAASAQFMYENNTMAGYIPEEGIRSALKHGTLALGQTGLAEALQILIGKNQCSDEGMKLAKDIEQLFKDKCAEFKEKYKLNFGVYYTPAENLVYTSMIKFKEKYGEIPNVSDRDYFTNSMHVPVWEEVDPYEKIDIESQLTGYSSAGCITYVELDSSCKHNIEALEKIVNYAMDHDIPYFAINVPADTCMNCGYTDQIDNECPVCGSDNIQRLRRVTGYLTGDYKTAFNAGKQAEVKDRVKHQKVVKANPLNEIRED